LPVGLLQYDDPASCALDGARHPGKDTIRSMRIISRAGETGWCGAPPTATIREGLPLILVHIDGMTAQSLRRIAASLRSFRLPVDRPRVYRWGACLS